jgi:hypothetical protein
MAAPGHIDPRQLASVVCCRILSIAPSIHDMLQIVTDTQLVLSMLLNLFILGHGCAIHIYEIRVRMHTLDRRSCNRVSLHVLTLDKRGIEDAHGFQFQKE